MNWLELNWNDDSNLLLFMLKNRYWTNELWDSFMKPSSINHLFPKNIRACVHSWMPINWKLTIHSSLTQRTYFYITAKGTSQSKLCYKQSLYQKSDLIFKFIRDSDMPPTANSKGKLKLVTGGDVLLAHILRSTIWCLNMWNYHE